MMLEVGLPHSGSFCLLQPKWYGGLGLGGQRKGRKAIPALSLTPSFELSRAFPMVSRWPGGECVCM